MFTLSVSDWLPNLPTPTRSDQITTTSALTRATHPPSTAFIHSLSQQSDSLREKNCPLDEEVGDHGGDGEIPFRRLLIMIYKIMFRSDY